MPKLLMMAGGTAPGDAGSAGWVSAYVVLSAGAQSRVFKVLGKMDARSVTIDELPAATTLDLKRFQEELKKDLYGMGVVRAADKDWVCSVVRAHLKANEGIDVA